jgi:hypothetical protein
MSVEEGIAYCLALIHMKFRLGVIWRTPPHLFWSLQLNHTFYPSALVKYRPVRSGSTEQRQEDTRRYYPLFRPAGERRGFVGGRRGFVGGRSGFVGGCRSFVGGRRGFVGGRRGLVGGRRGFVGGRRGFVGSCSFSPHCHAAMLQPRVASRTRVLRRCRANNSHAALRMNSCA